VADVTPPEADVPDGGPGGGDNGALDLRAVRGLWPAVLDHVKDKRRVTWMLLFDKVQVLGVDGHVLTIGFPDAGSVKGFTSGGHDEVLRMAIIDVVGADWRIDPVHQPGGVATTKTPRDVAAPAAPGAAAEADSPPADLPSEADSDAADDGLAGAELVVRELGGQVIGEHEAS